MAMPTLAALLGELRADPVAFLRHYRVDIAGGSAKTSGVATFCYTNANQSDGETIFAKGFTTGLSGLLGLAKQRRLVRFQKVALPARANGPNEFDAHYVAMTQTTDGVATTHVVAPGAGGPDILLTSQLSGCGFGIGSSNGNGDRLVSHIQPTGPGVGVHAQLVGGMAHGTDATFEKNPGGGGQDYAGSNRATVVGVRNGTAWRFYAQIYRTATDNRTLFKVETLN